MWPALTPPSVERVQMCKRPSPSLDVALPDMTGQRVVRRRGLLIGPRLNLRGAYLIGADLGGKASFVGVDFAGADLWGAWFVGADLRGAKLFGNLRGAWFGAWRASPARTSPEPTASAMCTSPERTSPARSDTQMRQFRKAGKVHTSSGELERAEDPGPAGTN